MQCNENEIACLKKIENKKDRNQQIIKFLDKTDCTPEIICKHLKENVGDILVDFSRLSRLSHERLPYLIAMRNIAGCGNEFSDLLICEMKNQIHLVYSVIAAYIDAIRSPGAGQDRLKSIVCSFFDQADLNKYDKEPQILHILMQQLYVHGDTPDDVRERMLLHPVVVQDFHSKDIDLKPYLKHLVLNLKEKPQLLKPILEKYKETLIEIVRRLADDIETNREPLEAAYSYYPEIGVQLQSCHFLDLLNHDDVSNDFAKAVVACLALPDSSPSQSNPIRAVFSTCLQKVQNTVFFTALFDNPELLRKVCLLKSEPEEVLRNNLVLRDFLKNEEMHAKLPSLWQDIDLQKIKDEVLTYNPRFLGSGERSPSGYASGYDSGLGFPSSVGENSK